MAKLDLHCHSTASDGALPPAELVARAAARGSRMLALTDHDCTAGLAEAGEAAREHGLDLIRGVEISVSWRTRTIHIVGLDIDPDCPALPAGFSPCAIFLALTTCAEVPGCRQETTPSPWQGLCMAG